jgi:hypothetical protein
VDVVLARAVGNELNEVGVLQRVLFSTNLQSLVGDGPFAAETRHKAPHECNCQFAYAQNGSESRTKICPVTKMQMAFGFTDGCTSVVWALNWVPAGRD